MTEPTNGNVTWAQFLRCVIIGIVFLIGLAGGIVAWTMSKTESAVMVKTKVEYHDQRLIVLEMKLDHMDVKIDKILEKVK